jgi:hypothetical protein
LIDEENPAEHSETGVHDRRAFRLAVERKDVEAMTATFREDAVLNSPVSFEPFRGRAAIGMLLRILMEVFEDFRYTDELSGEDGTLALVFEASVAGRELQGLDLIRFDELGRLRELTVMVRPRSGLEALMSAVGPRLAALSGGKGH